MDHRQEQKPRLIELLIAAGKAHHQAFIDSDGEDPDWPIWYAGHLHDDLAALLGRDVPRSRLVGCLIDAENERLARDPDAEWAPFYADHLLDRCAPADESTGDRLMLYHFDSCPFCVRVRRVIDRLGLDVELRDIRRDMQHWDDLVAERGRPTVPVLRIQSSDGTERWMPESADIIRYLDSTYGS